MELPPVVTLLVRHADGTSDLQTLKSADIDPAADLLATLDWQPGDHFTVVSYPLPTGATAAQVETEPARTRL